MTCENLTHVDTLEKLEAAIEESRFRPVLLFKHSTRCGISSGVFREVSSADAHINVIVVQTARSVADEIERRTGIRHQTPQAIVIKDGKPVYHASHWDITVEDIELHLQDRATAK